MTEEQFTAYLKENEHRLIIFGAGFFGERIMKTCQLNHITPLHFCDNDLSRLDKTIEGISIISFDDVKEKCETPIFIISPFEKEFQDAITEQISTVTFEMVEKYYISDFFKNIKEVYVESFIEEHEVINYKLRHYETTETDFLHATAFTFLITQKCSLNCEHCGQFIPYQQNPVHYETEVLFRYLDRIDELFDHITNVGVSGGEPLVNPDVYKIIAYAQKKSAIQTVVLLTNGTIVPPKEELQKLDKNKLSFWISNYGDLSTKRDELISLLKELEIPFVFSPREKWTDQLTIGFRDKSPSELEKTYRECSTRCKGIIDGKIFMCSHLETAGYQLHAFPKEEIQYVDFMDTQKTNQEIRDELLQYMYGLKYLKACNWCKGRTKSEHIYIEPAIQAKGKLFFDKTYED